MNAYHILLGAKSLRSESNEKKLDIHWQYDLLIKHCLSNL